MAEYRRVELNKRLWDAVGRNDIETSKVLLERGADVNTRINGLPVCWRFTIKELLGM